MNIEYCNNECQIGVAAKNLFLNLNNSAFDAVFDFQHFAENCFKVCPFKGVRKEFKNENI